MVGSGDNMHGEEAYGRVGAHARGEDTCMENLQVHHLVEHGADHVAVAGRGKGSFQLRVNEVMGAFDELLLGDVRMVEVGDERSWPGYKDHWAIAKEVQAVDLGGFPLSASFELVASQLG